MGGIKTWALKSWPPSMPRGFRTGRFDIVNRVKLTIQVSTPARLVRIWHERGGSAEAKDAVDSPPKAEGTCSPHARQSDAYVCEAIRTGWFERAVYDYLHDTVRWRGHARSAKRSDDHLATTAIASAWGFHRAVLVPSNAPRARVALRSRVRKNSSRILALFIIHRSRRGGFVGGGTRLRQLGDQKASLLLAQTRRMRAGRSMRHDSS